MADLYPGEPELASAQRCGHAEASPWAGSVGGFATRDRAGHIFRWLSNQLYGTNHLRVRPQNAVTVARTVS
jgi:hypothetical protein